MGCGNWSPSEQTLKILFSQSLNKLELTSGFRFESLKTEDGVGGEGSGGRGGGLFHTLFRRKSSTLIGENIRIL